MRPSRSNPCGWKPGIPASQGSRPEYDVSMCPLNISVGPPPVPGPRREHVRAPVLDLLPLHREPELLALAGHPRRHRLLGAR